MVKEKAKRKCEFRCRQPFWRVVHSRHFDEAVLVVYRHPTYDACQMHWTRVYRHGNPFALYKKDGRLVRK